MIQIAGIERVIQMINNDLTHIAIGSGVAPAITSTQLTSETLRKATTSTIDGSVLIEEIFLDTNEANGTISEIGIFCDGATATAGTGTLFASSAALIIKDNTQSLTISIEIEVKEVN